MQGGDTQPGLRRATLLRIAFGVIAVWLPCRFLFSVGTSFAVDWVNHEWLVGYFGQYARVHHGFPAALHTPELAGIPVPIFYGHLFYPLAGLASAVFAPGIVIRGIAIGLVALQYVLLTRAMRVLGLPWFVASATASLTIWAIYPLTNLYNRSAYTEFIATGLLVCAAAMLVLLAKTTDAPLRRLRASALVFFLMFAAGTHPITAIYGLPLFVCLAPAVWLLLRADKAHRRHISILVAGWGAVAIVCLLPWCIVTASLSKHLVVGGSYPTAVFFPSSIDHWATRLCPVPYDSRVVAGQPLSTVSTPYLDAQVSIPLLVLFIGATILAIRQRARRPLIILGVASAFVIFFLLLSLVPATYRLLPVRAGSIQFAYRAVTYVNLSALVGLMLALMSSETLVAAIRGRGVITVVALCLALAGAGVVIKWGHIAAILGHDSNPHVLLSAEEREGLVHLPRWFYGAPDYATPKLYESVPDGAPRDVTANFAINSKDRFGKPVSTRIEQPTAGWVTTNVLAFPWNEVFLDDVRVPDGELRRADDRIAVFVPEGSHKLATTFKTPHWWAVLSPLAIALSWAWALYLVVGYAWLAISRRRARAR